jgi:hypothetical protein
MKTCAEMNPDCRCGVWIGAKGWVTVVIVAFCADETLSHHCWKFFWILLLAWKRLIFPFI